jgi:hypothetical protein
MAAMSRAWLAPTFDCPGKRNSQVSSRLAQPEGRPDYAVERSRLRATALRRHFFACGEVAPPSLPALLPQAVGAYVQGWTVLEQRRSGCRGKRNSKVSSRLAQPEGRPDYVVERSRLPPKAGAGKRNSIMWQNRRTRTDAGALLLPT